MAGPSLTLSLLQEKRRSSKELRFQDSCNTPVLILKDSPPPRASNHYTRGMQLEGEKKEKKDEFESLVRNHIKCQSWKFFCNHTFKKPITGGKEWLISSSFKSIPQRWHTGFLPKTELHKNNLYNFITKTVVLPRHILFRRKVPNWTVREQLEHSL